MKILILQDDFPPESLGGAGIVAFRLASGFMKEGHDVLIITAVQDKSQEGETEYRGMRIYNIYSNYNERWRAYLSLYNPQTIKKVKKIIKEFSPNVVHVHNIHYHLSYYCLKLAKKSGAKVFLTAHDVMSFHYGKLTEFVNPKILSCSNEFNYKINWWQRMRKAGKRYNPFREIIIRHYLGYVNKIFAVSNALKKALNQNGIGNVEVIHNGIDIEEWQIENSLLRIFKEKYGLKNNKIVLFGGRLSEAKGGKQIIRAMAEVVKDVPEAVLLILGNKKRYREKMLDLARKSGIENKIVFTGWVSGGDLKAAYNASDVVATPSVYLDPFPTINLEAMACGKSVVGTCFGGTPEIVQGGVTGYIANPFDVIDFSRKIIFLLKDGIKSEEVGKRARQSVKDNFSLKNQVKKILAVFNK